MPVDFGLYSQNSMATSALAVHIFVEALRDDRPTLVVELEQEGDP